MNCLDCGKTTSKPTYVRCRSCRLNTFNKRPRLPRKPYPTGTCLNCNGQTSTKYGNVKYCRSCFIKTLIKLNKKHKGTIFHHSWKGENISYYHLHKWVRGLKPKPALCEKCKIKPPKDLSNNGHTYHRNIDDFEWLCRKCHFVKDNAGKYLELGRKYWPRKNKELKVKTWKQVNLEA